MKFNSKELIGENLYNVINKLNIDGNFIFFIKKTKGSNEKFNQDKNTPIVVRVNKISKKSIEIVVAYY
ncbi:MAG: hypothetical protein SCJ93_05475 [Bacillota bacterium]|nr:hypothetical protein [Bacillota bacterium]